MEQQTLYGQVVTHFALPLYLRPETEIDGERVLEIAETFRSTLLFPGCVLAKLDTKRAGMGRKLNLGAFTAARWKAASRCILNAEYAVVALGAHVPDFPNQTITLSVHVNPRGGDELLGFGTIEVSCSIPYLRHLATSPGKVEALLALAKAAWDGVDGGPAYGYGHLAVIPRRPAFDPRTPRLPGAPLPWEYVKPPETRSHAVPVAYAGNDIEGNLASLYCHGRGIKGAFWANFLSATYVAMAGGEAELRKNLDGIRVDRLNHGGLLVVAGATPMPDDDEETRDRYTRLDAALRPAYLSREETPENKRGMLGYFYRERA